MNVEDIREAFNGFLNANWTKTPIAWPNRDFDIETDSNSKGEFIRAFTRLGNAYIGEIGERTTGAVGHRSGIFMVSVYVLKNTGTKVALGYAKDLEDLFRREDLNLVVNDNCGCIIDEPYTYEMGPDDQHYGVMVVVPFSTFTGD